MAAGRETVIGWAEYVDLPDWHIRGMRAKSDTGARTSSLHVENLRRLRGGRLAFDVIVGREHKERVRVKAPLERMGMVKSSNGRREKRPFVKTWLRIGREVREIEVNLVDRSGMVHRMLLGRTALEGLIVDVSRRYITGHRRKHKSSASAAAKKSTKSTSTKSTSTKSTSTKSKSTKSTSTKSTSTKSKSTKSKSTKSTSTKSKSTTKATNRRRRRVA